jgi:hypothetical protein
MTATSMPPVAVPSPTPHAPGRRTRWRKALLIVGGVLIILLVGIQFVPVQRTNPPVTSLVAWDSPQTELLVRRACMDCHSNETRWPWYSHIAPGSWLIYYDVVRGRRGLNLSEYVAGRTESRENRPAQPTDLAYRLGRILAGGRQPAAPPPGGTGQFPPPRPGGTGQFPAPQPGQQPPGGAFGGGRRERDLGSRLKETVEEAEMPPGKYLLLHSDARLTAEERRQLVEGLTATLGLSTTPGAARP